MKVGIIGASGYTGAELMRILHLHPRLELSYVAAKTQAGKKVGELYPHLHPYRDLVYEKFDPEIALEKAELHFICLPHGESMEVAPTLLKGNAKVIDLSADFRLSSAEVYEEWYGIAHSAPDYLGEAVYGIPELKRGEIEKARLIAVPGCYPTASLLALAPLLSNGCIEGNQVIVDAKSGVSGAGRGLTLDTHFPQCEASVKPYGVAQHRHIPEMEQYLGEMVGSPIGVVFTPHLIPMSRGILASAYARVDGRLKPEDLYELYKDFYQNKLFVVVLQEGEYPQTKAVCGSNYCHLGVKLDPRNGWAIITSAIDNLVKGASGQAVQCANIMAGWREEEGLEELGIFP